MTGKPGSRRLIRWSLGNPLVLTEFASFKPGDVKGTIRRDMWFPFCIKRRPPTPWSYINPRVSPTSKALSTALQSRASVLNHREMKAVEDRRCQIRRRDSGSFYATSYSSSLCAIILKSRQSQLPLTITHLSRCWRSQ